MIKTIAISTDHRGVALKNEIVKYLKNKKIKVIDKGANDDKTIVHYPEYTAYVAKSVAAGEAELGIVICGSGIGASIVANKFDGIRCGLCTNEYMAEHGRSCDHINILALASDITEKELAFKMIDGFLSAIPLGGRYLERTKMISEIEKNRK